MEDNKYLEVRGLYKSFGNVDVLKGVDFTLRHGEILTIIGSSGKLFRACRQGNNFCGGRRAF